MMTNSTKKNPLKSLRYPLQYISFFVATMVGSHSAVAQPHVNFEMTEGSAQFLDTAVELMYPTRASSRGITGWVVVRFDIDTNGRVIESSVDIVSAEPRQIFDSPTIRASSP